MKYRSGGIPYVIEDGIIHMMFMKPSNAKYGGPDFQIAKGVIELGEDAYTSGLRECYEELGLLESNITDIYYLGKFLTSINVYLYRVKNKKDFIEPHFETGETVWMTPSQFDNTGRDIHRDIVTQAGEVILDRFIL